MIANKYKLSAFDWCAVALDVITENGVDAVAVEPLARRLGVTKGSFYWHFANRDALLTAALQSWERQVTDQVVAEVQTETDPRERIRRLFRVVDGSEYASRLYLALAAASNHPRIRSVVHRVSQRQLQYLRDCYLALGLTAEAAGHYATLAYSTFLGTLHLRREAPEAVPRDDTFHAYLDFVDDVLIPAETAGGKQTPSHLKKVSQLN